jgi:hypothetical protein
MDFLNDDSAFYHPQGVADAGSEFSKKISPFITLRRSW